MGPKRREKALLARPCGDGRYPESNLLADRDHVTDPVVLHEAGVRAHGLHPKRDRSVLIFPRFRRRRLRMTPLYTRGQIARGERSSGELIAQANHCDTIMGD